MTCFDVDSLVQVGIPVPLSHASVNTAAVTESLRLCYRSLELCC